MLRGYKKKGKPAPWLAAFPAQAVKSPAKKPKPTKPRKRIAPRSAKRITEDKVYAKLRAEFMMLRPRCERCGKQAVHCHHKQGHGKHYLEVATWASLCSKCHWWVHNNIDAARKEGWLPEKGHWA